MSPFIALTDDRWFDFLSTRARDGVVDEVNFWQPKGLVPMKRMEPGEPVFFRGKRRRPYIVGYGFFARYAVIPVELAWETFGWKNGADAPTNFYRNIAGYRGHDVSAPEHVGRLLGCNLLRDARFWPETRWIPWGAAEGWKPNIQKGKVENDATRASVLLRQVKLDAAAVPGDLAPRPVFRLLDLDERSRRERRVADREGQGLFRLSLLDAYGNACAVTGEHTEPVLDAAHIQDYLGPASNHVQNGLLLTKEWHALYDRGLVTVTPDYEVRVSQRIRDTWNNGHRYYGYDRRPLRLPENPALHPSREALDWHATKWREAS